MGVGGITDIGRIKSFLDLRIYILDNKPEIKEDLYSVEYLVENGEAEVFYEDSKVIGYKIYTQRACSMIPSNTTTCTAQGRFSEYDKYGQFYIINIKGDKKRQFHIHFKVREPKGTHEFKDYLNRDMKPVDAYKYNFDKIFPGTIFDPNATCLLYTSPSPRDRQKSRMPSSA